MQCLKHWFDTIDYSAWYWFEVFVEVKRWSLVIFNGPHWNHWIFSKKSKQSFMKGYKLKSKISIRFCQDETLGQTDDCQTVMLCFGISPHKFNSLTFVLRFRHSEWSRQQHNGRHFNGWTFWFLHRNLRIWTAKNRRRHGLVFSVQVSSHLHHNSSFSLQWKK